MKRVFLPLLALLLLINCKDNPVDPEPLVCAEAEAITDISERNFGMGFTSWIYAPEIEAKNNTYEFLEEHGDIYAEHLDDKIPWNAWINDTELPTAFLDDINDRVNRRIDSNELLLSVSLLNSLRTELIFDYDGSVPSYERLDDPDIRDAYVAHLRYLIDRFEPDYLVAAIEVNELYINIGEQAWQEYKSLMSAVRDSISQSHPDLPYSESVTLHNWITAEVDNESAYQQEIQHYVNQLDYASISYYPLFNNYHTIEEFSEAFDFLHSQVSIPISFVETTHLANDLVLESLDVTITSDECEQSQYLQVLAGYASQEDYEFIIWWAHRDFDALWETFPDEVKELGKIWRDTGLLDEDGNERPAYDQWEYLIDQ
jgi:hypothetical protein